MRLREYPYIAVRFACRECPRRGHYRLGSLMYVGRLDAS